MSPAPTEDPGRERGADVRVVPPVVFATGFSIGSLADRWHHLDLPGGWGTRTAGLALITAGAGLAAWGAATFRRRRTTLVPHHPVSALVTAGPYRFTRNPMYTGLAVAHAGAALALRTVWPLVTLPPTLVAVRRLVIDREERYLSQRFGADYDAYRRRVRRWL